MAVAEFQQRLHQGDGFSWYDAPQVRSLSIADFEDFCHQRAIHVDQQMALDTERGWRVEDDPNFNADIGVFVLSR